MLTDQQLLDHLRDLWGRVGKLSSVLIRRGQTSPATRTYTARFKSLNNAYSLIGYQTPRTFTDQTMGRVLKRRRHDLWLRSNHYCKQMAWVWRI